MTEDAITPAKDRIDAFRDMQQLGNHAVGAEYAVDNLRKACIYLEEQISGVGTHHIEEDAKRAGFEYPAPKAPD